MFNGQSFKRTPWAVFCPKHGQAFLTGDEYKRQLMKPNSRWTCPVMQADSDEIGLCGRTSEFDDDNYEIKETK